MPLTQVITVTFNELMDPKSFTQASFNLQGAAKIPGTVVYDGTTPTMSFITTSSLTTNIREGKGTVGKFFSDTTFAKTIEQAMVNIKLGAGGFNQNMNAAKHNFLLKGYFKKKKKQ